MKYITTMDIDGKLEIFTFPRSINHNDMMESLSGIKKSDFNSWKRERRDPISAGFVDVSGVCYGISESLGLKSREEEDTVLLIKQKSRV